MLPKEAQGILDRPDDPVVQRVFPVAYPGDHEAEAAYRDLVGGELVRKHRNELDVLSSTADANDIGVIELNQWLGALEVLRLMLGTSLDVGEVAEELPESDPLAAQVSVYRYLSWLQGEVIEALAASLPSGGREVEAY